jgi:hypothetical protein
MFAGAAHGATAPALDVNGEIKSPLALSAADLDALPRAMISVTDDNGTTDTKWYSRWLSSIQASPIRQFLWRTIATASR